MTKCKYCLVFEDVFGKEIQSAVVFEFPYNKGDTVLIGELQFVVKQRIVEPLKEKVKIILAEIED